MAQDNFLDIRLVSKKFACTNLDYHYQREKVKRLKIRRYKVKTSDPNTVKMFFELEGWTHWDGCCTERASKIFRPRCQLWSLAFKGPVSILCRPQRRSTKICLTYVSCVLFQKGTTASLLVFQSSDRQMTIQSLKTKKKMKKPMKKSSSRHWYSNGSRLWSLPTSWPMTCCCCCCCLIPLATSRPLLAEY